MIVLNVCAPSNSLPDFLSGATEQDGCRRDGDTDYDRTADHLLPFRAPV